MICGQAIATGIYTLIGIVGYIMFGDTVSEEVRILSMHLVDIFKMPYVSRSV
jgi:hypothetical protein